MTQADSGTGRQVASKPLPVDAQLVVVVVDTGCSIFVHGVTAIFSCYLPTFFLQTHLFSSAFYLLFAVASFLLRHLLLCVFASSDNVILGAVADCVHGVIEFAFDCLVFGNCVAHFSQ